MACSQELCKGDLVAVSVAMEAAGQESCITRGSIVGSDLPANSSLYVGKSHSPTYLLWQRATWIVGPSACARNDQATHAICNCQVSCFCIIATMIPYVMSHAISQHAKSLRNLATWTTDIIPIDIVIPYSRDQHVSANALQCNASANSTLSQSTSTNCNVIMLLPGKGIAGFSRQDMFKQPSGVGVHMTQRVFCLEPCHGLLPGLGMLQNLPSAVVAHVLGPMPGSRVLDMCASPGGGFKLFLNSGNFCTCLLSCHWVY